MGRTDKMVEASKEDSARKVSYVKEIVDDMVRLNIPVTSYSVWKKTGLSKGFIYSNEEVKEYISQFKSDKRYNSRKYGREDVFEQKVKELEAEIAFLKKELYLARKEGLDAIVMENRNLKQRLEKYEKLVSQGLLDNPDKKNNE